MAFSGFVYFKRGNRLTVYADTEQKQSYLEKLSDGSYQLKITERKDLPTYRLEEVKKHGRGAETIWVTCQCVRPFLTLIMIEN